MSFQGFLQGLFVTTTAYFFPFPLARRWIVRQIAAMLKSSITGSLRAFWVSGSVVFRLDVYRAYLEDEYT